MTDQRLIPTSDFSEGCLCAHRDHRDHQDSSLPPGPLRDPPCPGCPHRPPAF